MGDYERHYDENKDSIKRSVARGFLAVLCTIVRNSERKISFMGSIPSVFSLFPARLRQFPRLVPTRQWQFIPLFLSVARSREGSRRGKVEVVKGRLVARLKGPRAAVRRGKSSEPKR